MPPPKEQDKLKLWKLKQSKSHKGQHSSSKTEFKKGAIPWIKGKCHTQETKDKLSENHRGMHNSTSTEFKKGLIPWNKGLTKETDRRLKEIGIKTSKALKGKPQPKVSKALKGRKLSKEHIKNALKRRTPSSLEEKFQKIIDKYNLPYKYVGDGSFILGNFNPDFINTNNEKIAIEVYARYYKLRHKESIDEWKKERSEVFANYGWEIIYFNEIQVTETIVLNRLEGR